MPESDVQWLAGVTVSDLFRRFPLPIALLDASGGALFLNDHFERNYGRQALQSASVRALIGEAPTGWRALRVPRLHADETEIKAQILRVQGSPMLILDDETDPDLLRELDQLHRQVTELERLSATDRLTGAWNRAHLDRVAASELERSLRLKQPVSLLLIDIDHFKRVNDTHGHLSGDAVLCELVRVVSGAIRSGDTLFRWGGEEFVVLAPGAGYRACETLAEKLRSTVEQHEFAPVGRVTISIGVAEHVVSDSIAGWFKRVDEALYRAKNEGRNRVCVDRHGSSDLWATEGGASVLRLVWQEGYECGEPTIDREHRELFVLANALLDAVSNPKAGAEASKAALETLLAAIARHFTDEEALLAEHHYEHLEAHRRAHAGLLARAAELKAAFEAGTTTLGDLVEFLANSVIAQHLFKADRDYFPLFALH
jgi:diguanylate cyclase (GGDEF)-like protein/hemerythrin-like metal-binding protein